MHRALFIVGSAVAVLLSSSGVSLADVDPPWTLHTVTSGPRGADGVHLVDVDGDGRKDVASAWEEAGLVTVSLHPADAVQPWPTVTVGSRLHGVEDAVFADVDGDGAVDVVSACECRKIVIHFGPDDPARILDPAAWTTACEAPAGWRGGWLTWAETPLPQPPGVGQYQDVAAGRIDSDGDLDIVYSYSHADGDLSGVVWLSATPEGWERHEISGPPGTKFDNVELEDVDSDGDLDVVTSEQIEQLGVVWYENP